MSRVSRLLCFTVLSMGAGGGAALAQTAPQTSTAPSSATVSEVVVTGDPVRLVERKPNGSAFGLDKPILETPRSVTAVTDTTMDRYGIKSINDLVEISPSSYTASYYGVPGSLNIRGTLAENYFQGFKRIENRGTYATPIGDAAQVDVVRGPPTPIYGAGKVGGILNFVPKTAASEGGLANGPAGQVDATYGSYNLKDVTAQGGAPLTLGPATGGVYGYLDAEDAHSFYHGIYPKRETAELSGNFTLPQGWSTELDALIYHSDGDVQTPGWNRLTQTLIDHGTYITGRNTTLVDANHDGRIEYNEPGFYPFGGQYANLICFFYGCTNAVHQLTQGVGTAQLSPRTVFVSYADRSHTTTYTSYFNVAKQLTPDSAIKFESFYDNLNNERFVSYGFPASYQSYVVEQRLTYNVALDGWDGRVKSRSFVGASYRYAHAHVRESFNSGIIGPDRRDLADGPTATDIIASPFDIDPSTGKPGFPWELDIHSNIRDAGVFFTSDVMVFDKLDLIVGARDDSYNVSSDDIGVLSYEFPNHAHADHSRPTYNFSLSYKAPFGLLPYYTYDKAAALELDQASDLQPSTIGLGNDAWLSDSYLSEAGVKFDELNHTLVGSLSAYRQTRTQLVRGQQSSTIQGTLSKGFEVEIRYLATKNLSFTYAGDIQHTEVKGPDSSFVYLPPGVQGVSGINGYGAAYAATISTLPGRGGDYAYAIVPHSVNSVYATYTSNRYDWGQAGVTFGGTHVSKTTTLVQNPIVYPDYWLANLSGFYQYGPYRVSANIDNLFDQRYFTPDADPTYANVAALPGIGREWRIKVSRKF